MSKSRLRLFTLVSIFLTITNTNTNLVAGQRCRPDQTETLTRFKNEFAFSTTCNDTNFFRGAICDNTTGAVTSLTLPSRCLRGALRQNSSLFELRHLRYLDLSFNNLASSSSSSSSSLSSAFGQLNNLEILDLSSNGFLGQVPSSIRNLTKLTVLNLSNNKLTGNVTLFLQNLTKLSSLDLSNNQLSGTIPSSLFAMPFLSYLDLGNNLLTGSFETLDNFSSNLEVLRLGNNDFGVEIIDPVLKLVNLKRLSLSFLNISRSIDLSLFFSLKSLTYLNLQGNSLTPSSVSISGNDIPKNIRFLFLLGCNIGEFPSFLKSLKMLEKLDISDNEIKGNVPEWLWSLPLLNSVDLRSNSFTGFDGSLDRVLADSSVQILELALNSFKGPFPIPPLHILYLSAWNNSFTGDIPLSICNRTSSLVVFDLSYNNFVGSIPPCLSNFTIVNLRKNNLEGNIPDEFYKGSSTQTLDVGYNRLTGKLPRSLLNCSLLRFLSFDHNEINDTFPFWLKPLPNLRVLTLRSNVFHGPISQPDDQGPLGFPELRILEISHNQFSGSLPESYFANWSVTSRDEEKLYMGDYKNDGFYYVDTLDLQYKGLYMEQGEVLSFYAAIDFSGNKLEGEIPESIGLLKTLIALNLSRNSFIGNIPASFANATELESLDLSRNKLSGEMPRELGELSFLAYIDVSDNKLTGEIPQGTQIVGQAKSSFEGNLGLCGLPLDKSCVRVNTPSTQETEKEEEEEEEMLEWRGAIIGYVPGVLFGLGLGHVVVMYKPEWFIKSYCLNRA